MEAEMTVEQKRAEFYGWATAHLFLSFLLESGLWALLPASKRKARTRKNMPKPEAISAYWQPRIDDLGVFHDWQGELNHNECFACGDDRRVQRCHIVPAARGGSHDEWNLMLFCPNCHEESEHLPTQTFWAWVRNMRRDHWEPPVSHTFRRVEAYGFREISEKVSSGSVLDDSTIKEILRAVLTPPKGKVRQ